MDVRRLLTIMDRVYSDRGLPAARQITRVAVCAVITTACGPGGG
jgi:hypothetical protein